MLLRKLLNVSYIYIFVYIRKCNIRSRNFLKKAACCQGYKRIRCPPLAVLNLCFLRKFYRTCVPPLCLMRLWFHLLMVLLLLLLLVRDIIASGRLLSSSCFSFFEKAKGHCVQYSTVRGWAACGWLVGQRACPSVIERMAWGWPESTFPCDWGDGLGLARGHGTFPCDWEDGNCSIPLESSILHGGT